MKTIKEICDKPDPTQLLSWIAHVTGETLDHSGDAGYLCQVLRDGQILCKLANALEPGSVTKMSSSSIATEQMENIAFFLAFAKRHIAKCELFEIAQLYEARNPNAIVICLDALFQKTPKASYANANAANEKSKNEGKFVDLPGAEMGKVIVRFIPEASVYMHIGHAQTALLNQYHQQTFQGKLILRFDDTNPAEENARFEEVIKEDLAMLEIKPDRWTHSSDYFDKILEMCERLIKEGKAFVDDANIKRIRNEREWGKDSKMRNTSPTANLARWEEMKAGSTRGQQCCVRIKIDMNSENGNLRDPTIYSCKPEEHERTGIKYKVYPTYDFACPIVDFFEDVTHRLRTTEYHDRDDQYHYIADALGLRKPHIWEYARLNMTNTVMSKRKLNRLFKDDIVDEWDDPRFPTVRGVMRRGMTVEGLKQFIVAQGGSRSIVMTEWDKIWAFNKKVIDPVAPRYTALETTSPLVPVLIADMKTEESVKVNLHPKDAAIGEKTIHRGPKLLVEQIDAKEMKAGDVVTFVNWGSLKIVKVDTGKDGSIITAVHANLDLQNVDFKKTLKVTWLGDVPKPAAVPIVAFTYDHIISKAVIGKDEDWKQYINKESIAYTKMVGEPAIVGLNKGDVIQLQRKGFYRVDQPYIAPKSKYTGVETPLLLIAIPDGSAQPSKSAPAKGTAPTAVAAAPAADAAADLYAQIEAQGVLVRDVKAKDVKSNTSTLDAWLQEGQDCAQSLAVDERRWLEARLIELRIDRLLKKIGMEEKESDPVKLRNYADKFLVGRRTITLHEFEKILQEISNLGGKVEKWEGNEEIRKKLRLRKWRDDYDANKMDELLKSLLGYVRYLVEVEKTVDFEVIRKLESMIGGFEEIRKTRSGETVVVDWLNAVPNFHSLLKREEADKDDRNSLSPYSLVIVSRVGTVSPAETDRITKIELSKTGTYSDVDDLCALILAVASRGYLLTNDLMKDHVDGFEAHLKSQSKDVNQADILQKYLNDAVLRHYKRDGMQPMVDHSRAAQWIEKKELAFTTIRRANDCNGSPYFYVNYYSLHIK